MLVECSNCGAPLDVTKRTGVVRCGYCGRPNKLRATRMLAEQTPAQWAPPPIWTPPPNYRATQAQLAYHEHRQTAGAGAIFIPLVGLGLLIAGVAMFTVMRSTPSHLASERAATDDGPLAPGPTAQPHKGIPLAKLKDFAGTGGWQEVEAPRFTGTASSFDPIVNLPWALTIAKAWSADAVLASLYLQGARTDGTMDITSKWADYRFVSPAKLDAAQKEKETSEARTVVTMFRVKPTPAGASVLALAALEGRPDAVKRPFRSSCRLDQAFATWKKEGLPTRPSYDLMLTGLGQWRWQLNMTDDEFRKMRPLPAEECTR